MYLRDDEKRILDGEQGDLSRRCMEYLVAYGEAAGAEYLVDIDGTADLHPGKRISWIDQFQITEEDVLGCVARGEHFKVPTFANKPIAPSFIVDGWEKCGTCRQCDPKFHAENMARFDPLIKMGMIPMYSCDYYLVSSYLPTVGQHCSWGESSAIPWCNAILGARTNIDGSFQTAYLGKVPAYDMHLNENRIATLEIHSEVPLRSDMEYDLFGWAAGEIAGHEVPALTGIGRPTTSQLCKMNSSLNTGGEVRMYHVPGLTPEATCIEQAFAGRPIKRREVITRKDLKRVYEMLNYCSGSDVDFVYLGCPHYNIVDIQRVARRLEGKKCKRPIWIMTNHWTYQTAEQMGCKAIIENAGGVLLSGSCVDIITEMPPAKRVALDAAKQNYYMTGCFHEVEVCYGTMEECIDSAITGRWEGRWI